MSLETTRSAALLAFYIWHAANNLMVDRHQIGAPAMGKFWSRAKAFSGIDDTDQLATFLLGFKQTGRGGSWGEGTTIGFNVGAGADDELLIENLVNQIDADCQAGDIRVPAARRSVQGVVLPPHLNADLSQRQFPGFFTYRYRSAKSVRSARTTARTAAFRSAQGGMRPRRRAN